MKKKNWSLRSRIMALTLGILLLIISVYIVGAYYFVNNSLEKELNKEYDNLLLESTETMEKLLWNLTLTSQQIWSNKVIKEELANLMGSQNNYEKKQSYSNLIRTIVMLTMPNSDIGLIYFYDPGNQKMLYNSFPIAKERKEAPTLYESDNLHFGGPSMSQSNYSNLPVLSLRLRETIDEKPLILAIETGFESLETLTRNIETKSARIVVTNETSEIIYSTFGETMNHDTLADQLSKKEMKGHRVFRKESPQGWAVNIVVPEAVYLKDFYLTIRGVIYSTGILIVILLSIVLYFWKTIDKPLIQFENQLNLLLTKDDSVKHMHSSIAEYDRLFRKVGALQQEIENTIEKVVQQEKVNGKLQVAKLRAQINPHFLLNTLNTIHWMALLNQQNEIDDITQSLSHLLIYNLDKESYYTNLDKEIEAVKEYVALQKVRYNFTFEVISDKKTSGLNYPCPKFILQPVIENSLKHGFKEGMHITVCVEVGEVVSLTISDTGRGMTKETLEQLKKRIDEEYKMEADKDLGNGIGLQYVVKSLEEFFAGDYTYVVDSTPDVGTSVSITFPKLKGEGYHD